jgi:hypothetical protein
MCWARRAFLRHLHLRGLNPLALAGCVPSIRQWKFASLPTYLSAAQVQRVLEGCDRTTALGRRDYAILMMLVGLGLRAGEVATLTLDDIDWRAGEMLVRAKGRQRVRMPMPREVGVAVVAYLRDGRPISDRAAACTSLSPSAVVDCCISMFIVSSGACPARSVCGAQAITPDLACTTSGIASPSGRFSAGIARGSTSSRSSRRSPPTSVTPACAIPIGISQPVRS